jgi:hypothetical protein
MDRRTAQRGIHRTEINTRFDALQGRMEIRFDQQLHVLIVAVLVITIVLASN